MTQSIVEQIAALPEMPKAIAAHELQWAPGKSVGGQATASVFAGIPSGERETALRARLFLLQRAVDGYLAAVDGAAEYVDFKTRPWGEFVADERRALADLRLAAVAVREGK
jgi:hypothetical protein